MSMETDLGIDSGGNDRPAVKDLHNHIVPTVAHKWRDLGTQLLNDKQQIHLNTICTNHPHNAEKCCKLMFSKWLETNTKASWNQLITALKSPGVELIQFAENIQQKLQDGDGDGEKVSGGKQTVTQLLTTSLEQLDVAENAMSIENLELEFANVTDQIKQALSRGNISVHSLVEQLSTLSAVKYKKVPLFDDNIFEKVNTIQELWKILRKYWSIFDYDILMYVVQITNCQEARNIFGKFLSTIDSASLEDFDLILSCEPYKGESFKPLLRIKIGEKECTQAVQKQVKEVVSKAFNLEEYSLRFKSIKEGCVVLISNAMMTYLVQCDVDGHMLAKFAEYKIIYLRIKNMELTVPADHKNLDEFDWYAWSSPLSNTDISKEDTDLGYSSISTDEQPLRKKIKLESDSQSYSLPSSSMEKGVVEAENEWQQFIKRLTCVVCSKPCIDPQILPCFHVYCKECTEKKVFGNVPSMLSCPICKTPFKEYEITSIPANAAISALEKILHMQMEIGSGFLKMECDRCSEGYSAVMWCADCKNMYCDTCKSIHETWREFKLHDTVTIEEYLQHPNNMLKSREVPEICKIHTQMPLDLYCETCNQLICDDCIDEHYKHQYDFIDNVMNTVGKELKQTLSSLTNCLKDVRNTVKVIEDYEKQIDTVDKPITERIHNLYNEMFKMLRQQKGKRIECIHDIRKSFKVSLMERKEMAKHIESQLMNCLHYSSNVVNTRQLFLHNKWIISKVDNIIKQVQHTGLDLEYEPNELLVAYASRPTVVSHFSLLTDTDFLLLPSQVPECSLNAARVGYSVKLMVTLSDKYYLPVIDQSRHLEIHCNKENIIQNMQIEEQSDGCYYMWYIPRRKEDHSVSIYWRNLPLISKEIELSADFIRNINIIDKYGPSSKLLQMPYLLGKGVKDKIVFNDDSTNQLIVYDQNFNFLHVIGLDESFKGIAGIALYKERLFVAVQHQNLVVKLELDGNFINCFGSSGTSEGQFHSPHGLVFSQSEYLFVCDRYNHRIQVFKNEKFAYCFGKHGTEPGAFNQPVDLTLNNSESQLFITDNRNDRVQVFSPQGQFLTVFGDFSGVPITLQHPVGIFYTPDNYLLVSSYGTDSVFIFKEDGRFHSSVKDTQKFNSPCGVAMINRQIVIASHLKNRLIIC